MDTDIVKRMRDEEADLERKLNAVRTFLAAYDSSGGANAVDAGKPTKASEPRSRVAIEGFGEYGRRIVVHSMMAMLTTPHPMKTRAVVEFLEAMSLQITGENKVNAVGALLSRSIDITSHGKVGWTLANPEQARAIVAKYGPKENEAPSEQSPEPQKPTGWGVPAPSPVPSNPNPWPGA